MRVARGFDVVRLHDFADKSKARNGVAFVLALSAL
jgi:hypothetical protein